MLVGVQCLIDAFLYQNREGKGVFHEPRRSYRFFKVPTSFYFEVKAGAGRESWQGTPF
jgi:hypothetical protein